MDIQHRRTCVYEIGYHLVFCVKYRRKVLVGPFEAVLKDTLQAIAYDKEFDLVLHETDRDHLHLFVSAPPHVSISTLVKWIKGISARRLLATFPELKAQLYKGHLWTPSYYVGTVGTISEETVTRYIQSQKERV